MNGSFLWAFLLSRALMQNFVSPGDINRSAAISALGASGGIAVPILFSQEIKGLIRRTQALSRRERVEIRSEDRGDRGSEERDGTIQSDQIVEIVQKCLDDNKMGKE